MWTRGITLQRMAYHVRRIHFFKRRHWIGDFKLVVKISIALMYTENNENEGVLLRVS